MEHLVTFETAEGRDGHHTAASLDDALRFVERLRNNEEASGVRVFRLEEIPIEFKAYFKVEVGGSKPEATAAPERPVVPGPEAVGERADDAPAPALVPAANGEADAADGSRRLFQRGS